MAKTNSKKRKKDDDSSRQNVRSSVETQKRRPKDEKRGNDSPTAKRVGLRKFFQRFSRNSPHKSFHRTYREDYVRELNVPGMGQQIFEAFAWIFREVVFRVIVSFICA